MTEPAKTKLTSKCQITVPKAVRDRLGLEPGDEIEFVETQQGFKVVKVIDPARHSRSGPASLSTCGAQLRTS